MDINISLEQLRSAHVLVVGDAMLDRYWHGAVERISPEAPVPVVRVQRIEERIGAAANVAYNVVALGAAASFVGVIGEDEAGDILQKLLQTSGIATYLARDTSLQTTVKLRVIGRQQQLVRLDFENMPDHDVLAVQTKIFQDLLSQHQAVLFSDYAKGGLMHISEMITAAKALGKPVLVDPKGSDYERYRGANVITPNRSELTQVIGAWESEADLHSRVQRLRESLAIETLIFTRSEEGMSLYDAEGETHVKSQAREVFDVTGAGDTVIATLATLVAAGLSPRDAMAHANRAGGIVVGKFGTASVSYTELFGEVGSL